MQHSIFQSWIKQVNQQMRNQHRNILLLVDNVSSHHLEEGKVLSNVKLHFLPPNTTAHLQPIDQGIIHSFKVIILIKLNFIFYYIYIIDFFFK